MWNLLQGDNSHKKTEEKLVESVLKGQILAKTHPEADELERMLADTLRYIDSDGQCERLIGMKLQKYFSLSDKFECQYDYATNILYVRSPPATEYRFSFGIIYFFELWRAATGIGGYKPPSEAAGVKTMAEFIHSVNLAGMERLAKIAGGWSQQVRNRVRDVLSPDAWLFVESAKSGIKREEMYEKYVAIFERT